MLPASIIIPAHNEGAVIARCLESVTQGAEKGVVEIIVVCNGCNDNTAEIARRYEGVTVVELEQASKTAALNAGDKLRSDLPVVYLDADVVLSGQDLQLCLAALGKNGISIASPRIEVDTKQSSFLVRAFYSVWTRLPYFSNCAMVGSGVYALSREGRSRFGSFPEVIADDGYVRSLFGPDERLTVKAASFRVFAPRDLATLIKIKARVRLGNKQIRDKFPHLTVGGENSASKSIGFLICRPWLLPAVVVYAYVQLRTISIARQRLATGSFGWDRDTSSRKA